MTNNQDFAYSKLAVIIPFNGLFNEEQGVLIDNCVASIPTGVDYYFVANNECVVPNNITEDKLIRVESDGSFCDNVNKGVAALAKQYEWVSILEFDDTFNAGVFTNNLERYVKHYNDYSVFLWLNFLVDQKQNSFIGFANEAVWAMAFSMELGNIEEDCLKDFFAFTVNGGVIKRELFEKYQGLKGNIKIYFWYEWLYRMVKNGEKMFVIPKVAYSHYLMRDGSLFLSYQQTVNEKENNYWLNVAKESASLVEDNTAYTYVENVK